MVFFISHIQRTAWAVVAQQQSGELEDNIFLVSFHQMATALSRAQLATHP